MVASRVFSAPAATGQWQGRDTPRTTARSCPDSSADVGHGIVTASKLDDDRRLQTRWLRWLRLLGEPVLEQACVGRCPNHSRLPLSDAVRDSESGLESRLVRRGTKSRLSKELE